MSPNDPLFDPDRPGDALRCHLRGELVEGVFLGFDRNGFLRLRVGAEERLLSAGSLETAEEMADHDG